MAVIKDDFDSDDESLPELEWMLGFAEEPTEPSLLLRHRFPCKVGGAPAWLDPVDLPLPEELVCGVSGLPLDFLCQLYAPVDTPSGKAFHRTVLVFISPKGNQLHQQGAVRAFRCQLGRTNPFYAFEPPGDSDTAPRPLTLEQQAELGDRDRWAGPQASGKLYKELCLEVEPEDDGYEEDDEGQDDGKLSNVEQRTAKLLQEYQEREAVEGSHSARDLKDVEELVNEGVTPERKHMAMFCAEIMKNPEQCIRYCFDEGAKPLCPCASPKPPESAEVPPCSRCGAPRKFEFQILPQLLHYMELDESEADVPDWGSIAIYSCSASCSPEDRTTPRSTSGSHAYAEEFVWVQPPADRADGEQ